MRITSATLAIAGLAASTSANAAGWLCVTEQSTGFSYNSSSKSWREASFKADKKYVVRSSQKEGYLWEVAELGETSDVASAYCRDNPNEIGNLFCNGLGGDFRINTKNNRFIYVYFLGYWTYDPDSWVFKNEGGDTPTMSIGRCSSI